MATTSALQAIPLPENVDPVDFVGDLASAVDVIEPRLVMRYATTGARDLAITAPEEGMLTFVTGTNSFYFYRGGWRKSSFVLIGLAADRPSTATVPEGTHYYETDTNLLKAVVASAWVILNAESLAGGSDTNASAVVINATEKKIHEITIPANPDYALQVFVFGYATFGGGGTADDLTVNLRQGGLAGTLKASGRDRAPASGWGHASMSDTLTIAKGASSTDRTFTLTISGSAANGHTTPNNGSSVGIDYVAIPNKL